MDADSVLARLRSMASRKNLEGMARFGMKAVGMAVPRGGGGRVASLADGGRGRKGPGPA